MNIFYKIPRWALCQMSISEAFVFAYIHGFKSWCRISTDTIAEHLQMPVRTVRNALTGLCESGCIESRPCKNRGIHELNVNAAMITACSKQWISENRTRKKPIPPELTVSQEIVFRFGATVSSLLIANILQMQQGIDTKYAECGSEMCMGVRITQAELCEQCSCSRMQVSRAIKSLNAAGILEVETSNIKWHESFLTYRVNL